ncbi:MAG: HPr(Ser) kinase/phosphatase [Oscillospiraceae bacterium]|jgi:HPr kinase/phosphorylase|nr:HPr(Ser) kinase/phosphatase [Oscillospiraceae bacterium]
MEQNNGFKLSSLTEQLRLDIVYPSSDYEQVLIFSGDVHRPGLQLAGYYDYFDPTRVQLFGKMEISYLEKFASAERISMLDGLMAQKIPALVICHGAELLDDIITAAENNDVSVLSTDRNTTDVMSDVIRTVKKSTAPRITRHGVLVEIYGIGVLLLGESGVGKSEAAIELLKRGHRLIADDAVEIQATDVNVIEGTAPELIRHYMELRGIGVIDVRQIFGVGSIKNRQNIHLVVNLEPWKDGVLYDRLGINEQTVNILGVEVSELTIPVRPGRNLAVILEVAAMNQRQKFMGFNAALEFTQQINKHFETKI